MHITNVSTAKAHLSMRIERVMAGEEVIIGKAGKPVAKLVRYECTQTRRRPGALPLHHRDPFDRMLVAQARAEGFRIVTRDPAFARYRVPVLGA